MPWPPISVGRAATDMRLIEKNEWGGRIISGGILDPLMEAKVFVERWRKEYDELWPHISLGDLTPSQFVDKYKITFEAEKLHFWLDHFSGQVH